MRYMNDLYPKEYKNFRIPDHYLWNFDKRVQREYQ